MVSILLKSAGIWLLFVLAAIVNGVVRDKVVSAKLGEQASLPLSGLSLSAVIVAITWLTLPFLGQLSAERYFVVGSFWVVLTLLFEYLFGHFVAGHSWSAINKVFHIHKGNLFLLALIITVLSPWLAAKLRGWV